MPTNVDVPPLGESVTEAVLLRWLKNDGEYVTADEPICELETDKANVDLAAKGAGLLRHAKAAGETVHVGEAIGRIDEAPAPAASDKAVAQKPPAAVKAEASAPKSVAAPAEKVPVAPRPAAAPARRGESGELRPAVRRLVEENHLESGKIPASGPHGQLTKEDVLREMERQRSGNGQAMDESEVDDDGPPVVAQSVAPAPARAVSEAQAQQPKVPAGPSTFDADGLRRTPMSKIRKRIADRMVSAQQTAAILTTFNEIDCSSVLALRAKYKERFQEIHGVGLGLMSFFARAVVLSLREFPRINAEIDGNDILYHRDVHLGIAVSTDRGLAVPVLRKADSLSFAKIESEIKRLAASTRDGKLSLEELTGGTFTITNGGVYGSLLSTPILNPPQSGILGMHAILKRPIAVGDKVEIRPMMYVALSYDHRLVDGKESVSFLVRLKEYLEDPARLMLEI